jgi:hypothetical protein
MKLDQEILDAFSNDNKCSLVDDGYNSDPQDDLESPEDQEHVAGHHNGSNTVAYEPLMQLTEVALNLPVATPAPIEPPPQPSAWVESLPKHLMTTSTSDGTDPDEECAKWLSDHPIDPDNLTHQSVVGPSVIAPPIKPLVITPGVDYVAQALIDTEWEICAVHPEVDPDPTVSEPTSSPTPKGESMGSPTDV